MMNKRLKLTFILIFISSLAIMSIPVKSQSTANIIISPDGSITGTTAIVQDGDVYTLTANITNDVFVQRSNIIVDGAGFAIIGKEMDKPLIDLTYGVGNPSTPQIYNVTIRNLMVVNGSIQTNGGGNNTFYNNYIDVISLRGSTYNNITHCIIRNIEMSYGASFNTITENNIMNGVSAFLVSNVTVDKNYWRFYLTEYPNATEVGNTGIGNQPYVYWIVETSTPLIYQDNHPLMKPVSIPLMSSSTASDVPEFPYLSVVAVLVIIAVSASAVLIARRRKT